MTVGSTAEATAAQNQDWPVYGLSSDVRPALAEALRAGVPAAMITLHAAEGATPLGLGAQMLFAGPAPTGFLSGGCVEGDVALQAKAVLADGRPRRLVYGQGGPPDIQLLCGSRIELLAERIEPDSPAARRLIALSAARRPALWLSDGRTQACLAEGEAVDDLPDDLRPVFAEALNQPAPAGFAGQALYRRFDPPSRLVVVGGDPIALAICRLAADIGLEAVLVRPKGPPEPPPVRLLAYLRGSPGEAIGQLAIDPWTAVAVASHDIAIDHAALAAALPSPAAYVGVLGSRRRIPERLGRLRAEGLSEADLLRLNAPMGLNIGARSPFEIGVSVVAEVISALRAREARRIWPAAPPAEGTEARRVKG
ncbi:MAG TPA: XdhC family protein [Caulobacteraceae bacterium]|jgi:xanthine dehydrogenase accessory factor|nr:XdhC family protein [Caulobacteraceae bacterium]